MDIINELFCILRNFFYWIIENLLWLLDVIIIFVLGILPNSPFNFQQLEWGIFGNIVGYFIPVATILSHFVTILSVITIYYGVRYLLRFVKLVQ